MKKSIKYAGIAAATLLTVAPVAAPALSTASTTVKAAEAATQAQTTVTYKTTDGKIIGEPQVIKGDVNSVQQLNIPAGYVAIDGSTTITLGADTTPVTKDVTVKISSDTDDSNVKTAMTNFGDQFSNMNVDTLTDNAGNVNLGSFELGSSNSAKSDDFLASIKPLLKNASNLTETDKNVLNSHDAQFYIVATDNQGNTYDGSTTLNRDQLQKAMAMDKYLPVEFTVYGQYKALGSKVYGSYEKVATFNVNKSNENEIKSVNAKFSTPINVAKNSKTAATKLTNPAGVSLVDQDGNSVATKDISLGNKFYYTYAAAMNNNGTTGVVDQNGSDIKDGEFKTAGTYYQRVTFTANASSSLAYLINKYQSDPDNYTIYVNGKQATSGYDFTTNAGEQTITFVRAIKVSDSEAEWTTTDKAGVVTTKSANAYYTLKDDEGNTITNRALAKNTDWATDKVRTDQDGNQQYRVATGEWIDANDVTFSEKGSSNNNEGEYTDVQALNGKVTLDGPSSFIYMLYNDNGASVSNRALAGNSEWYTDKKATNAAGQTVYHVATGEWVQAGNGVNYVAY
ncbi:hypothetical protein [Companilactobacillus musae]|uniref:hypothetical protein n=1 Tax=Companilactobacillus musae TaxID=1903258 RepID=UPI000E657AA8|nr:hypothetical protein [Companilactobacillus musae]